MTKQEDRAKRIIIQNVHDYLGVYYENTPEIVNTLMLAQCSEHKEAATFKEGGVVVCCCKKFYAELHAMPTPKMFKKPKHPLAISLEEGKKMAREKVS